MSVNHILDGARDTPITDGGQKAPRFNPMQARLFYRSQVQGGSLGAPLMISGTIKASPMKLCTVLLKAYQNTKRNF